MKITRIKKIELVNYRNFSKFEINISSNLPIIIGKNGSGKTNILESISYISPGRGLRSVSYEQACLDNKISWQSNFLLNSKIGTAEIYSKYDFEQRKRLLKYFR